MSGGMPGVRRSLRVTHESLEKRRQQVIEIVRRRAHHLARKEGHGVLVEIENAVQLAQRLDEGGRGLGDRSVRADRDDRQAGSALMDGFELGDDALELLRIAPGGLRAEQDGRQTAVRAGDDLRVGRVVDGDRLPPVLFELLLELLQARPGHGGRADFAVGDEDGKLLAEKHGRLRTSGVAAA